MDSPHENAAIGDRGGSAWSFLFNRRIGVQKFGRDLSASRVDSAREKGSGTKSVFFVALFSTLGCGFAAPGFNAVDRVAVGLELTGIPNSNTVRQLHA